MTLIKPPTRIQTPRCQAFPAKVALTFGGGWCDRLTQSFAYQATWALTLRRGRGERTLASFGVNDSGASRRGGFRPPTPPPAPNGCTLSPILGSFTYLPEM